MDIEVHISFDTNSIFVQAGKLNKKYANLIALERAFHRIIAIGETEEEIARRDPAGWERIKGAIVFEPIFNPQNFDGEGVYWATRMFLSNIHHELRGVNLFDQILCHVNIPKYELFPAKSREHFEMRLERWPKLRTLTVNGTVAFSKGWRYQFAKFSLDWGWRVFLVMLVLVLLIRLDVSFAILTPLVAQLSYGMIALTVFLVLGIFWTSEIIWLLVMQSLLPKQPLRRIFASYQLQFAKDNKMTISKMLARWILRETE